MPDYEQKVEAGVEEAAKQQQIKMPESMPAIFKVQPSLRIIIIGLWQCDVMIKYVNKQQEKSWLTADYSWPSETPVPCIN